VLTPTAAYILGNGSYLYVTAYNANATPYAGYIFGFAIGSTGALTPIDGGVPVSAGSEPVALTGDSGGQNLYVADESIDKVESFSVQSGGTLKPLGTYPTGNQPSSLTLIQNKYLYVANSLDATVTAYTASAGTLSKIGDFASDANPVAVIGDPRDLGFLYTVNFLDGTLSGYKIDQTNGSLINTDRSPYFSTPQPTAISGIPHGGSTH